MQPLKKQTTTVMESPDIRGALQLAIHTRDLLKSKFDYLEEVKTEYEMSELKVIVWGSQDMDAIQDELYEMMEDEFSCSPIDLVREEYPTLIIYKLTIPKHIDQWFEDNIW